MFDKSSLPSVVGFSMEKIIDKGKGGMNTHIATLNQESFSNVTLLVFENLSCNDSIQQKWLSEVFIYTFLLLMVEL